MDRWKAVTFPIRRRAAESYACSGLAGGRTQPGDLTPVASGQLAERRTEGRSPSTIRLCHLACGTTRIRTPAPLRYGYSSMTTPSTTLYELNMDSGKRTLLKQQPVAGFVPAQYASSVAG